LPDALDVPSDVAEQVEISAKYAGYIDRQKAEVERTRAQDDLPIPASVDYGAIRGLSREARQKLAQHRPGTIGQASRLQGITPATISLLLVHLKRLQQAKEKSA
jgi:tRNA uridine 5-carboxymethylaminomethyl modification enzyme